MTRSKANNGLDSLAIVLSEDKVLMTILEGLKSGTIGWNDIPDELGIDVETGNPIPDGSTEA